MKHQKIPFFRFHGRPTLAKTTKVVGEIAQLVGQVPIAPVHLGRVDERRELVDLLPLLQPVKENGGGARAAGGAAARELNAAARLRVSRVMRRNWDGKAGRGRLAGGAAGLAGAEGLAADRLQGVVKVVVEKLAPLHHHVGQPRVGGHLGGGDEPGGEQPGSGFAVAVVKSLGVVAYNECNNKN